jgi:hypothetical protein
MAYKMKLESSKTYANEANMEKGIRKAMPRIDEMEVRYFTAWNEEGRCYPVFVGSEAVNQGIHFHFVVVG